MICRTYKKSNKYLVINRDIEIDKISLGTVQRAFIFFATKRQTFPRIFNRTSKLYFASA